MTTDLPLSSRSETEEIPTRGRMVYEITDPRTGKVFYVGASWRFHGRQKEHMRLAVRSTRRTIEAILATGTTPEFRMVGTADNATERRSLELKTIAQHLRAGTKLTNPHTDHRLALARFPAASVN